MPQPDELPGDVAALLESGQSNQKSLAAVTCGAAVTGRPAAEAVWRLRVSDVLRGSVRLGESAAVFDAPVKEDGPPARPYFPVARILQGNGDGNRLHAVGPPPLLRFRLVSVYPVRP
jgi:hypothetical protein